MKTCSLITSFESCLNFFDTLHGLAKQLVPLTLDCRVSGFNYVGGEILPKTK